MAAERQPGDQTGGLDAGHRADFGDQRFVELGFLGPLVPVAGERHRTDGEDAIRNEARIHGSQLLKTLEHQSSADQQHQRERDFDGDQDIPKQCAPAAGRGGSAAFLHRLRQARAHRSERRHEPDNNSGQHGYDRREPQDGSVHTNGFDAWNRAGHFDQQIGPECGQDQPAAGAADGQQQAFPKKTFGQLDSRSS